jgi:hypothetical protein
MLSRVFERRVIVCDPQKMAETSKLQNGFMKLQFGFMKLQVGASLIVYIFYRRIQTEEKRCVRDLLKGVILKERRIITL